MPRGQADTTSGFLRRPAPKRTEDSGTQNGEHAMNIQQYLEDSFMRKLLADLRNANNNMQKLVRS